MADLDLLHKDDFEAVEAAVMETARGRWFLAEYLRRHRAADTDAVLSAIGRLGSALAPRDEADRRKETVQLQQIRQAIAVARDEMVAIRPVGIEGQGDGTTLDWPGLIAGGDDLGEMLLEAAGEIQELGRRYRATPGSGRSGERLAARAAEIPAECLSRVEITALFS